MKNYNYFDITLEMPIALQHFTHSISILRPKNKIRIEKIKKIYAK